MDQVTACIKGVNYSNLESALRLAASDLGWTATAEKYEKAVNYRIARWILQQMEIVTVNRQDGYDIYVATCLPFGVASKKQVLKYLQAFSKHLMDLEKNVENLEWSTYYRL